MLWAGLGVAGPGRPAWQPASSGRSSGLQRLDRSLAALRPRRGGCPLCWHALLTPAPAPAPAPVPALPARRRHQRGRPARSVLPARRAALRQEGGLPQLRLCDLRHARRRGKGRRRAGQQVSSAALAAAACARAPPGAWGVVLGVGSRPAQRPPPLPRSLLCMCR